MTKQNLRNAALVGIGLVVASCAPAPQAKINKIADSLTDDICNENYESSFWNSFYLSAQEETFSIDSDRLQRMVEEKIGTKLYGPINEQDKVTIARTISSAYQVLANSELVQKLRNNPEDLLALYASLELGDRTSAEKEELLNRLAPHFETLKKLSDGLDCHKSTPTTPIAEKIPLFDYLKQTKPAAQYGAWKTLATAYQSCDVLNLPPMDVATESVKGISVVGTHPNGKGKKRVVSNVPLAASTHYYIRNHKVPGPGCFDTSHAPLIYDYGGKPYAEKDLNSILDFFKNAGSGTTTLGTDCSGFVFSAYAAAGLKMKRESPLKAVLVSGVSAAMIANPQRNGLTCLKPIDLDGVKTIQTGDLAASSGHVVMIDTVGADPFGLASIKSAGQCTSANVSSRNFDFVVIQSSPSKGAIGINRFDAKDYLATSASMKAGFEAYAVAACKSKFTGRTPKAASSFTISRHAGDAQCFDHEISLARSSCLNACVVE